MHDHHDHNHDDHTHRDLEAIEEPLDAASQSLSDALKASFGILKIIMAVLCVLYVFSNVRRVESHEQALRLRLGALVPGPPYEAGLVWALPFPIEEIITLPTRASNEIIIDSHTFARRSDEIGKPLSMISRGGSEGLKPALDGALLTADAGLVHARWKVTYKIEDVAQYITRMHGRSVEAAETLINRLVENAGIHVASDLTAEEAIRTRTEWAQSEIRRLVNDQLRVLESGITVTRVEMFEPTPPIPVRASFDNTQVAENAKQKRIRDAEQERTKILSEAAGTAHRALLNLLDRLEAAQAAGEPTEELEQELEELLTNRVEGMAGQRIKDAGSFHSRVVNQIQSDVELYRTLLPEFQRNPAVLVARLWESTQQQIFDYDGVSKFYRPRGAQLRLHIPIDPEEARRAEERRLREKEFDASDLRPTRWEPVGPEFD
jgi:modulator of FtsH protease HflK